jgi:hypothetical protein
MRNFNREISTAVAMHGAYFDRLSKLAILTAVLSCTMKSDGRRLYKEEREAAFTYFTLHKL